MTISISEACETETERRLASIWCILERFNIPSPSLRVEFSDRVSVSVVFQTREDAELVVQNFAEIQNLKSPSTLGSLEENQKAIKAKLCDDGKK